MGKKGFLSESDALQIFRRYNPVTVMGLLREVARCGNSRLDWNALVRKSATGISSAREYQALWRHIAYRAELADSYADDAEPSDDESDLEFELLPSPAVSADATAEAVRWVKAAQASPIFFQVILEADLQRFDVSGRKKGEMLSKSKSRDGGFPTTGSQARISSGVSVNAIDVGRKGALVAVGVPVGNSSTTSPPSGVACQIPDTTSECPSGSRIGLGQSERKKRKLWSGEEDQELIAAVDKFGEGNWTNILKSAFTHERTAAQLSQRWALIRKRRDVQAGLNKPTSGTISPGSADGQESDIQTSPADTSPQANIGQNAGKLANGKPHLLQATAVENASVNEDVAPSTATQSPSSPPGSRSQIHVSSTSSAALGSTGVNSAVNGLVATSGCVASPGIKGGVVQQGGTFVRAGTNSGQRQATAVGAAHCTSGSSTAAAVMAVGQVGSVNAGVGAGRLIAPGAVVMSAAAAQAASVGGSEMWNATTMPAAGVLTSGPAKYVVRNAGVPGVRVMSMKPLTGPDPGVQAAAVAAGARIAPASAAASLLKAAQSGNVVHIGPGGVPITKPGLPSQTTGHSTSVGSRGSSGANVHYICTGAAAPPPVLPGILPSGQRPVQQPKNQLTKPTVTNQTGVTVPKPSVSPVSNVNSQASPATSQPK